MSLSFRDLTENEIEVRVGIQRDSGLSLLLYKDARCDMAILDETVGPENWQREHYECKGNLFCRVGINTNYHYINNNTPNWVYKADCGAESNTEKEKGEASDSFKRACVNWGIGRELYTAPFIWIPNKKGLYELNDKGKCTDNFVVEKISIDNKKIVGLAIRNETLGKRIYVVKLNDGNG